MMTIDWAGPLFYLPIGKIAVMASGDGFRFSDRGLAFERAFYRKALAKRQEDQRDEVMT